MTSRPLLKIPSSRSSLPKTLSDLINPANGGRSEGISSPTYSEDSPTVGPTFKVNMKDPIKGPIVSFHNPEENYSFKQFLSELENLALTEHPPTENSRDLHWGNGSAIAKFYDCVKLTGREPDFVVPTMEGMALWRHPTKFFHSYEIRDLPYDILRKSQRVMIVRYPYIFKHGTLVKLPEIGSLLNATFWYEPSSRLLAIECYHIFEAYLVCALLKMYDSNDVPLTDLATVQETLSSYWKEKDSGRFLGLLEKFISPM